ncbi:hypothetical protein E1181_26195 [Saccharopolyspora terrae]|uniref:Uncharacterized protein n=1 Tax=Saccharopolyspora terrae TaxID=2530384 RepID=A0A4R4V7S8_9PSEU|nr:hypothetical protein E1181_26195 [Saccharopolyspora terrae]
MSDAWHGQGARRSWRRCEDLAMSWVPTQPEGVLRHPGTNGWSSSFGTVAHGELAGCPPQQECR